MPVGELIPFAQKKWCHIGLGGHIREMRIYVRVASLKTSTVNWLGYLTPPPAPNRQAIPAAD